MNAIPLSHPEILAPAGDSKAFCAALAAGADALYLGLKNFSARMEAENFSFRELSRHIDLAHAHGARVYCALNTMLKHNELIQSFHCLERLRTLPLDGIIVQDLAFLDLVQQTGFSGGLFFSTLANITHPEILPSLAAMGVDRVILPRELSLDEIRTMGSHCPENLTLELFVHGALCYCVSGRCYWSSYMGGKSGLRGRCVQPCRRRYSLQYAPKTERAQGKQGASSSYFSCQDLSLAEVTQELLQIPQLNSWKIEGRKKGPHYVYHTVKAYRLLRDYPKDAKAHVEANTLLAMALGRPTTHARIYPTKPLVPTDPSGKTSSGLFVGTLVASDEGMALLAKVDIAAHDFLRIGSEEEKWHQTLAVQHPIAQGTRTVLRLQGKTKPPSKAPVYLIDRREKEVVLGLKKMGTELAEIPGVEAKAVTASLHLPKRCVAKRRYDITLLDQIPLGRQNRSQKHTLLGLWLSKKTVGISKTVAKRVSWWLPPVVWPNESSKIAALVHALWRDGCRHFVVNAPWQRVFFPDQLDDESDLVAGPFCNVANALSLKALADMGFQAAFVSPELSEETILSLPKVSPIPLGFVLDGYFPVGISRFGLLGMKQHTPFTSPKGEVFWVREYGQNVWIYPAWPLDFRSKEGVLLDAGYAFFAHIMQAKPQSLTVPDRPGLFNWEHPLL